MHRKLRLSDIRQLHEAKIVPAHESSRQVLKANGRLAAIDTAFGNAQRYFVELMPTTPQVFATGSKHNIQASEPDLIINATQLVINRVTAASTNNQ